MLKLNYYSLFLLILGISISLFSLDTRSADSESTSEKSISLKALKGTFLQSKNIKPLKRPFKSEGSFVYLPNKGLLWNTIKPIKSLVLFADDGVFKIDEQGILHNEAQLDNEFFLALFSMDEKKLSTYFSIENFFEKNQSQSSCLGLTPVNETMGNLFNQINLCTDKVEVSVITPHVVDIPTKIVLIEVKGNTTEILLTLSSEKVTLEELAYFD